MPGRERGLEWVFFALAVAFFLPGLLRDRQSSPPYSPGPRPSSTLRVATWNVGAGMEDGGLEEADLDHVAATLRAIDPDLVFLMEVRSESQGRRLHDRLGESWETASKAGVMALCQRGRLEVFDVERAFRLRAIGVVYRSPGRDPGAAIGLHARAFSARSRNDAVGTTATTLESRSERWKILAGDLNLDLDLDKRGDLFTDDEHLDVETYNYLNERFVDAARNSGPTAEPDRRLDYVFASRDWPVLGGGAWKGRRAPEMDHDPVVVDLRSR